MVIGIGVKSISEDLIVEVNPGNPVDLEFGKHAPEIVAPTQEDLYQNSMWPKAVRVPFTVFHFQIFKI